MVVLDCRLHDTTRHDSYSSIPCLYFSTLKAHDAHTVRQTIHSALIFIFHYSSQSTKLPLDFVLVLPEFCWYTVGTNGKRRQYHHHVTLCVLKCAVDFGAAVHCSRKLTPVHAANVTQRYILRYLVKLNICVS